MAQAPRSGLRGAIAAAAQAGLLVLLAAALPWAGAGAEGLTRTGPVSREQITLSFAPVVKQTAPAVVNIFSRQVVREQPFAPLFDDPVFRQFFGNDLPLGRPRQRVQNSLGSGVVVRADGLIVTNHHVIKNAEQIRVELADRREFDATVVRSDPRTDLALLRIDLRGESLPALPLGNSDDLEVGDLVLAIGNPFGVGQTVTSGIISALARETAGVSDYRFFIQTDAAINPGNSGGALVSMQGKLIGINSAIYSRSGGSVGIGFAIPVNLVRPLVEGGAASGGKGLARPWLGVSGQTVTAELAASLGLERPGGVLVSAIDRRSPALAAGLRPGDVILALDGHPLADPEELRFRLATLSLGERTRLEISRQGERQNLTCALIRAPETPAREITQVGGNSPFTGAVVANLSPALAEELDLQGSAEGVVVTEVKRGAPAAQLGLKTGDVLLALNGRELASVRELLELLRQSGRQWSIKVRRGAQVLTSTIRG